MERPKVRTTAVDRMAWLKRALARERRLARIRHWSYSLNRHLALREEVERLRRRERKRDGAALPI